MVILVNQSNTQCDPEASTSECSSGESSPLVVGLRPNPFTQDLLLNIMSRQSRALLRGNKPFGSHHLWTIQLDCQSSLIPCNYTTAGLIFDLHRHSSTIAPLEPSNQPATPGGRAQWNRPLGFCSSLAEANQDSSSSSFACNSSSPAQHPVMTGSNATRFRAEGGCWELFHHCWFRAGQTVSHL